MDSFVPFESGLYNNFLCDKIKMFAFLSQGN